jgi:hypothetical protein
MPRYRATALAVAGILAALPGFGSVPETDPAEALRGTWRGTSICVDKATDTFCHDEVVVYEFEAAGQPRGKVVWRPSKIVNGSVLPMGDLELAWDAAEKTWSKEFTSPRFHGRWSLAVNGPKMTGSLVELPSGRMARRVEAERDAASASGDVARLEALHEKVMVAHRRGDVEMLLEDEAEDYVVASRGEVTHPSLDERRASLGPYLKSTKFEQYRDAVDPVVRVSPDGLLGWVVVQVSARGVQMGAGGETTPVEFVSAWIELYAKRGGKWYRVGNVSNFKPE